MPVWIYEYVPVQKEPVIVKSTPPPAPKRVPFLQIHGNVMYNVNYYSNIDTPYNEQDIYQHTIQTYLDITVKGKYPMRVYLTNRFSNSNLFRDFSDINLSFNPTVFKQRIKDTVRKIFLAAVPTPKILDSLQSELDKSLLKLRSLEGWIKNPALLQKMVEERERIMKAIKKGLSTKKDSTLNKIDSITSPVEEEYTQTKQKIDSLKKRLTDLHQSLKIAYEKSRANVTQIIKEIEQADNPENLKKLMGKLHIGDSVLPKGYKVLMALRSFGIGRSVVNYSELSAKNISVNGIQVEYNPSSYYALAAGRVDYRFRDFIVRNPGRSAQNLAILRYGRGLKNGNNVILTFFTGNRQLYNPVTVDTLNVQVPATSLMGFTLEGNYRITENIEVTAEVAKSSVPGFGNKNESLASQMLQMNKRDNEAYSLKANALFPKTATRVRGSFKRLGANFQSFSTFTDGSAQTAWSANVQQPFFKNQLTVMLGAQTNDFSNPFIGSQYRSTTVFKSIQATLRKRNWPVISAGYYPSSQVTKLGNGHFKENLFYTLTANVNHAYRLNQALMNSTAVYTQFYNKATDSAFVYFNTKNLLLSQTVFLQKFTLQMNAATAMNQDYKLYTLEGKANCELNKVLSLGGGVKYNKQTVFDIEQFGFSAEATLQIPQFGQVQFSADKGFLPGMNRQLVPNNTGRLTYFKTF